MANISRRNLVLGGIAVGVAAGTEGVWRLHQSLPPRDRTAEERFRRAQNVLLADQEDGFTPASFNSATLNFACRCSKAVRRSGSVYPWRYGMAAQWEPLLSRLNASFHVYAPDRPGCGLTEIYSYRNIPFREHAVTFVRSTMDALGVDRASLIGELHEWIFQPCFRTRSSRTHIAAHHYKRTGRQCTNPLMATRGINGLLCSTIMNLVPPQTLESFRRMLVAHPERISRPYLECWTAASLIRGATESWLTMLEDVTPRSRQSTLTYALRPELEPIEAPTMLI